MRDLQRSTSRTRRGGRRREHPVARVWAGAVIALTVAAMLSTGRLVEMAERRPLGPDRDRWLGVAVAIDDVATRARLDRPAGALQTDDARVEVVLGELAMAPDAISGALPTTTQPAEDPTPPTSASSPAATAPPAAVASAPSTTSTPTTGPSTTAPPTTAAPLPFRPADPTEPLRIWAGGDSLGEYVGSELLHRVADADRTDVELDYVISTGLARPDYFDWPARLSTVFDDAVSDAAASEATAPQVVVFMVGGNDDQDLLDDDRERRVLGTDEWAAAYEARIATMMDVAARPDTHVLWINLPRMRDDRRDRIAATVNAAIDRAAAERPWVDVVDVTALLADPDGAYTDHLVRDGATIRIRARDGVHVTRAGSTLVAEVVWEQILDRWILPEPADPDDVASS